jgi:pyridoxamine-phosphate oxidase
MVLLKKYDKHGFTFFTNGLSRKGKEMGENPNVALLFYWPFVNRQVRIEGKVEKIPIEDVEDYWNSRPLNSRIGGAISQQSSVIESRQVCKYFFQMNFAFQVLEKQRVELNLLVAEAGHHVVKRPETWWGYIVKPNYFEFWQGNSFWQLINIYRFL